MKRFEGIILKLAVIHLLFVAIAQLFVLETNSAAYLNRIHLYEGTAGERPAETLEAGIPDGR